MFGPSIKPGTWNIAEHSGTFRNIQEHPGTSNNYNNYEKNMKNYIFDTEKIFWEVGESVGEG